MADDWEERREAYLAAMAGWRERRRRRGPDLGALGMFWGSMACLLAVPLGMALSAPLGARVGVLAALWGILGGAGLAGVGFISHGLYEGADPEPKFWRDE